MDEGRSITFHAEANPDPERRAELEATDPTNPLCRSVYLDARGALGHQPWILALRQGGKLVSVCAAFLKAGRLNRALSIPSLPFLAASETFWTGTITLCKNCNVTLLEVNSICSGCDPIPVLGKELFRRARHEWVVDLRTHDPRKDYTKGRKSDINKARKAGLQIRRTVEEAACLELLRLAEHSLERRQRRGEAISAHPSLREMLALIRGGVGEFFQCVNQEGTPLSSSLVLMADRGAAYWLAGTSAEGMSCGASSLLLHEIIMTVREAGKEVFYLGGGAPGMPLRHFKASFGAKPLEGDSAEFLVGSRLRFEVGRLVQLLGWRPAASL